MWGEMAAMRVTDLINPLLALQGISHWIDRVIGANDLKPHLREVLRLDQLRSSVQMAPMLFAGSLVVSLIFVALNYGRATQWPILAWAGTINLLQGYAYLAWRGIRLRPTPLSRIGVAVPRAAAVCFMIGALWGFAVAIQPADDPMLRAAVIVGAGSMLTATIFALVNFPQLSGAFMVPLLIGIAYSILRLDSAADATVSALLLGGFVSVLVPMSLRHARMFVQHRASQSMIDEKREIIALLLKEFEDSTSDWIWGFDSAGRIERVSRGFMTATGLPQSDLIGADFVQFLQCITPLNDPLMQQLERDFASRQTFSDVEIRVTAGSNECWWRLTGKPTEDASGRFIGYIGTGSDVTQQKLAEKRITTLAHNDSLTGLLNRTKFTEHLNQSVARLERYGSSFSILFLDLDQFKAVNDSRGHITGDKLLAQVAKRITTLVRENDCVARLGGDEFAILLTNEVAPEHCAGLAARLIEDIRRPYLIDDEAISIGVSIGIAIAPINGTRPDQLLRNADLALYRAKADGRSVYRFFEAQMDFDARERRMLELELRDAIRNGELVLHYQPLVSANDRKPSGFEALIRWHHPIRGLVSPAEFIPIAEQSNLIIEIGDWTIEQACLAAANWPEEFTVAVNLSAKHFKMSDIALVVKKALTVSGITSERLEIEITEGLLIDDPEAVTAKLDELRQLGVTIVMDDFGTGYSSLSYLLKFPFDKIKIDKSFVDASTRDPVARDILKAIATLGKTLKLTITAEGVETKEQAEFLSEIACHQLQGFYFARPLDGIDLPRYLLAQVTGEAYLPRDLQDVEIEPIRKAG